MRGFLRKTFSWIRRYILAAPLRFVAIVVGLIFLGMGFKIGILHRFGILLSKISPKPVNSLPPVYRRSDDNGKPIPPGVVDKEGYIQPVAYPLPPPSFFDDPKKVVIETEEGEKIEVTLPEGVDRSDVEEVLVITPTVVTVTVTPKEENGKNPPDVQTLDKLLEKYGGNGK